MNSVEENEAFFNSEFYKKWLELSEINNDFVKNISGFNYNKVVYEQEEEKNKGES